MALNPESEGPLDADPLCNQAVLEMVLEPGLGLCCTVWWRTILLKPLYIQPVRCVAIASAQTIPKSYQDLAVPRRVDYCGVTIAIFHSNGAGNTLRTDRAPSRAFLTVQQPLCYLTWCFSTPVAVILAVNTPVQMEVRFI